MPRKRRISNEMIIEASIELIREKSYHEFSARNVAKVIKCSTQPIYSCFESLEKLSAEVVKTIHNRLLNDYMLVENDEDPFLNMGIGIVEFAREEGNLFEFLYFSPFSKRIEKSSYQKLIKQMSRGDLMDGFTEEQLIKMHMTISIYTHGLAALIMHNPIRFSKEEVKEMLIEIGQSTSAWELKKMKDK